MIGRYKWLKLRKNCFFKFSAPNSSKPENKNIILPEDVQNEYNSSYFSKLSHVYKSQDLKNGLKSLFIFKDYIIPNTKKDP